MAGCLRGRVPYPLGGRNRPQPKFREARREELPERHGGAWARSSSQYEPGPWARAPLECRNLALLGSGADLVVDLARDPATKLAAPMAAARQSPPLGLGRIWRRDLAPSGRRDLSTVHTAGRSVFLVGGGILSLWCWSEREAGRCGRRGGRGGWVGQLHLLHESSTWFCLQWSRV